MTRQMASNMMRMKILLESKDASLGVESEIRRLWRKIQRDARPNEVIAVGLTSPTSYSFIIRGPS